LPRPRRVRELPRLSTASTLATPRSLPGDAFVELPSTVDIGRNETTGTVELGVVFGVPVGGSPRVDQPQPENCAIT